MPINNNEWAGGGAGQEIEIGPLQTPQIGFVRFLTGRAASCR